MKLTKNKTVKDFGMVLVSNILVLFSSILTGLVIPKLLGVANYGYYKIFTLYLGYTALLHFGFVDGILLFHAGEDYSKINVLKFRRDTRFFGKTQIIVSIIIIIVSAIVFEGIYKFMFIMIGVDTIATNMTSYYQYVSQCTMRFKELSIRKVYQAALRILMTVTFFLFHWVGVIGNLSAYIYIFCLVAIDILLLIWYVVTYREITFGTAEKLRNNFNEIIGYYKRGIVLTIAFQVANLIFNLDRQFVSILYNTETYALYSFAYSLISMATTVIGAVSLVLFPNLKRRSRATISDDFSKGMAAIAILVFAAHIGYYPLCGFIKWFLPDYVQSLVYLKIIFPGLAISSCISVIIFTYYKLLDKNIIYFIISCFVLLISALLNWMAYVLFETPEAISWASVVTLLIWYIMSELYFIKDYHVKWKKNFIYILLVSVGFYGTAFLVENNIIGIVLYTIIFAAITILFYKQLIVESLGMIRKVK